MHGRYDIKRDPLYKQVSPYSIIVVESHDIMSPLMGGTAVPFAGLHQSEGNSLATFLSVTGGAFLSNWSRAPSQLDREKKEEELSAPPGQGEGERDGEEYVKMYFVGFLISQP